jgi:hypothetical protein
VGQIKKEIASQMGTVRGKSPQPSNLKVLQTGLPSIAPMADFIAWGAPEAGVQF